MTNQTAESDATSRGGEDLSAEIARTISRGAREVVTCRRITRQHYRCNWWVPQDTIAYDNPGMGGLLVTTNRVCRSHFLRATKTAAGLQLAVVSAGGPARVLELIRPPAAAE